MCSQRQEHSHILSRCLCLAAIPSKAAEGFPGGNAGLTGPRAACLRDALQPLLMRPAFHSDGKNSQQLVSLTERELSEQNRYNGPRNAEFSFGFQNFQSKGITSLVRTSQLQQCRFLSTAWLAALVFLRVASDGLTVVRSCPSLAPGAGLQRQARPILLFACALLRAVTPSVCFPTPDLD